MKKMVISYSLTGNNTALAEGIAQELTCEHHSITDGINKINYGSIILDILFNRTPKVALPELNISKNDLIILVGPVWMGKMATPLRSFIHKYRDLINNFALVSLSGGADGINKKLESELHHRMGKTPITVLNFLIFDLLNVKTKPSRQNLDDYRPEAKDIKKLSLALVDNLKSKLKHL